VLTVQRVKGRLVHDYIYTKLVNARVKAVRWESLASPISFLARRVGRRVQAVDGHGYDVLECVTLENALPRLIKSFRPDVVVTGSVSRVAWRDIRAQLRSAGIPSVLYLREANAVGHLSISAAPPDLLLANAESHAAAARALGYDCAIVPSVVEPAQTLQSTSETALLVNAKHTHGGDVAVALAAECPDIPFVLQESWLLEQHEWRELRRHAEVLDNLEILPFTRDMSAVYGRARVLLVPHRMDNRPRVILEAQAHGVPVIAHDWPGLREAVGDGGVLIARDADLATWKAALRSVWDDRFEQERLSAAARGHAARPEVDPDAIVTRFVDLVTSLVVTSPARADACA
jgi:hypothetical protein